MKITLERKKARVTKGKKITKRAKTITITAQGKTKNCFRSKRQYAKEYKWFSPLKKVRHKYLVNACLFLDAKVSFMVTLQDS